MTWLLLHKSDHWTFSPSSNSRSLWSWGLIIHFEKHFLPPVFLWPEPARTLRVILLGQLDTSHLMEISFPDDQPREQIYFLVTHFVHRLYLSFLSNKSPSKQHMILYMKYSGTHI